MLQRKHAYTETIIKHSSTSTNNNNRTSWVFLISFHIFFRLVFFHPQPVCRSRCECMIFDANFRCRVNILSRCFNYFQHNRFFVCVSLLLCCFCYRNRYHHRWMLLLLMQLLQIFNATEPKQFDSIQFRAIINICLMILLFSMTDWFHFIRNVVFGGGIFLNQFFFSLFHCCWQVKHIRSVLFEFFLTVHRIRVCGWVCEGVNFFFSEFALGDFPYISRWNIEIHCVHIWLLNGFALRAV